MKIKYLKKCKIELTFYYNKELIENIKKIFPNYKYNPKKKTWTVYINPSLYVEQLNFLKNNGFKFESDKDRINLRQCVLQFKEKEKYFKLQEPKEKNLIENKIVKEIRPYQIVTLEYLKKYKRLLLGDEMGLGKTLQIIYAIHNLSLYPVLIVTPNILKINWKNEFMKWFDIQEYEISVISSNNYRIKNKQKIDLNDFNKKIVIINYDLLKKYEKEINNIKWKMLVVDEAHFIKSNKAQRTKIIKKIAKKIEYISLLTGTPVLNRPPEIITLLQILGYYEIVGGYRWFLDNYIGGISWEEKRTWWTDEELKQLHLSLARTVYIRREKKVLTLPEKMRSVVIFDVEDKQKELEKAEKEQIIRLLEKNEKLPSLLLENIKNKDLIDIYTELYNLIDDNIIEKNILQILKLTLIKAYQIATINVKLPYIYDWIDNFVSNNPNEKLVIFGIHREPMKKIKSYLDKKYKIDTPIIIGEISDKKRQNYLNSFKKNKNIPFILLNIRAGGTGLTLTEANNLLFIEFDWTPANMLQAEDRIHRIGQIKTASIYYLALENSIDMMILEKLKEKMRYSSAINSGSIIDFEMKEIDGNKKNLYKKLF